MTADPAPLATLTSKVYVVSEAPSATAPRGQWMFCGELLISAQPSDEPANDTVAGN